MILCALIQETGKCVLATEERKRHIITEIAFKIEKEGKERERKGRERMNFEEDETQTSMIDPQVNFI